MTNRISIVSSEGTLGKTSLSLNLATHFTSKGKRTCLYDAIPEFTGAGLPSASQSNKANMIHSCGTRVEGVMLQYHGVDILTGGSWIGGIGWNDLDQRLGSLLDTLCGTGSYDFMIFDTSAHVARNVISFCAASMQVILVMSPDDISIRDAYMLLKVLNGNGYNNAVKIAVNSAETVDAAKKLCKQFSSVARNHLGMTVEPLDTRKGVFSEKIVPMWS